MINTIKVKNRCKELNRYICTLAEPLGITTSALYHKISNRRPMKLSEAVIIQKELEIPDTEFCDYFIHEN